MQLPNNIAFAIASAFAAAVSITAITNANEAVASATNTFAAGEYVEYTGGWSAANGRVFRLKAASGTTFTLEGLDTTDTSLFPAGQGTGTVRKITTWVPVTGVVGAEVSGGDGKTVEVPLLDSNMPVMLPDGFSATTVTLTTADDKSLPHHAALKAVSDGVKLTCLRGTLPNGGVLLYAGYCSFNESPSLAKGSVMAVKSIFSLQNKVVRY
ncbi:phage tail tube protein [Massilia sp. YIM B02443]|uniref:phage tail tube protein n=1 Tax=Massilia sp. YIM B02443 TaxID=3050127 RepID=UPI0025B71317|nr:phage tail tube protein [Massilia sp. YIM B02443]MDN4040195.1 phage tail tube protein [Massilia sp. YIM B02443]